MRRREREKPITLCVCACMCTYVGVCVGADAVLGKAGLGLGDMCEQGRHEMA